MGSQGEVLKNTTPQIERKCEMTQGESIRPGVEKHHRC